MPGQEKQLMAGQAQQPILQPTNAQQLLQPAQAPQMTSAVAGIVQSAQNDSGMGQQ